MELRVLSQLDVARTQCYHFRATIISGMGFLTDAYDLFCIPPLSTLLGRLYYGGTLPPGVNSAVNGVALCGLFVGNLFFGWLGDRMGRKKVYGITLILMMGSSIASGFSIGKSRGSVIATLCFFRFWLGVGIGGDYPLSATIIAEYANTKSRGVLMAAVLAMYAVGMLAGSVVVMTVSACFKALYPHPTFGQNDIVWRIILMLGAVPAATTYYWRMKVPETARFTALVVKNVDKAAADMSKVLDITITEDETNVIRISTGRPSFGLFTKAFAKLHGKHLVGTMSCWFFLDMAFYSSNLFQKDIYRSIGWLKSSEAYKNPMDEVFHIARAQALIGLCGTMPGCLATIMLIDRFGRFKIQLFGFLFMSLLLIVMAVPYETYWINESHRIGFVSVYSLTFFFTTFGPNSTTFIVPAELFPTRMRSTCHGISAAAGKVGAAIAAFGFLYAAQPTDKSSPHHDKGYPTGMGIGKTLLLLALASFLGFLCTFLIPETMGRSLEENEEEVGPAESDSVCDFSVEMNSTNSE